ncbi:MAG TPA: alpha-amylase family glycosyl hydrolase [Streptosporangiaceae bacterium]|nr:alpha-amylase family glycosyl hydrolase [Streptosporangiaceae bacterium]
MEHGTTGHDTAGRPWWHGAALYQLYVRSWLDSDGDGYGDLRGIISRLDHLEWLGLDGIWLSPTMPSPDTDWGYDVSDYTDVHPELGTLADLDELIADAASRGMRVLLDLVPNHTSSAHPWFVDAVSGRDSEHRDYYVWADAAPGGGPPNNWLDSTGKSAWEWDAGTSQYYLHNFLVSQPDLSWWLPAVHEQFRQILDFWFGRGVAGFRIDVAHGLYKDPQLRDNPPIGRDDPLEGRHGLRPVYSANQPEVHDVYRDWRKIAEKYSPSRLLLGETWVGDPAALAKFYGDHDELQLAFNFPFVFANFTAAELSDVVRRTLSSVPDGACPVWMASNHDVGRFPTRWCGNDGRQARLALLVLATMPGTMVLYYGDEIGMLDVEVPPELQRDEMTLGAVGPQGNRDRARTPMHWDGSPSGGFTTAARPWLPVGDSAARNVASQRDDPRSVLALCRDLLALRRAELGGRIAPYEQLEVTGGLWAYRVGDLTVLANLSDRPATWSAPCGEILLSTGAAPDADPAAAPGVTLAPWQGLITRPPA